LKIAKLKTYLKAQTHNLKTLGIQKIHEKLPC